MIEFEIQNFRQYETSVRLELDPITLLIGANNSGAASALPDSPIVDGFYSPDENNDESIRWFTDSVPANTARFYITRSIINYRFELTNAEGFLIGPDFGILEALSPNTMGIANDGDSPLDFFVRFENMYSSSFGCQPVIIETVDRPHP
jgi:hypothetical protein